MNLVAELIASAISGRSTPEAMKRLVAILVSDHQVLSCSLDGQVPDLES